MTQHAKLTFSFESWDEQPLAGSEGGAKLTRAHVANSYSGDLSGHGELDYLMVYRDGDATARFLGFERFAGCLHGRSGGFVLEHQGEFRDGVASGSWTVVPDSGRGELVGLRGSGGFRARHGENQTPATLDYDVG